MSSFLFSIYVGLAAGAVAVIPMFAQRLSAKSCLSTFLQYLFVAIIILNINLPYLPWWTEGAVISFLMAIPIVLVLTGKDKRTTPVILLNSIILGVLISLAGHFLR